MISHVLNGFGEDLINTDFGEYCPNYESADFNYVYMTILRNKIQSF